MNYHILKTKLHCPSPPSKLVNRPHLLQSLNDGLAAGREITLVSAPAGYGKTTCISEWVNSLNIPVTWLSLDQSDDDPLHFYIYLIAALRAIDPDFGQEIESVIRSGQIPPSEIVSASLINGMLDFEDRFVLVLDDFHVLQDNSILDFLRKLIENHPWPLHLVFITREDPPLPLAKLRANNKLTEIRAKDLRFVGTDIKVFLNKVLGLSLQDGDISILEAKTEGWIAGLQLIGLTVKEKSDPSGFISELSGSHQFILSYITEQVLNQQSEEVRDFLFKTAILDQFNRELCEAITGRSDAGEMLERLSKANLFLVPLDDEHQWYRYHHFFADLLRDLQKKSEIINLSVIHQRAGRWYAQANMYNEAIRHALLAEDYQMAVNLLESHTTAILMQGYAKTVDMWIQAIPEEWRSKFPKTNLAIAWIYLLRGDYAGLSRYIDLTEPFLAGTNNDSLRSEWLVMKSLQLYMRGEIETCMALAEKAFSIVPAQESRILGLVYYIQAHGLLLEGNYAESSSLFQKSIQYSRLAKSLVPEMMSTISLVGAAFDRGKLHQAYEIAAQAVNRLENIDELPPISAYIYLALGEILFQWHRIEEGQQVTRRAFQLSSLGGLNTGLVFCRVLFSRFFLQQQKLTAASTEIRAAADLIPLEGPKYIQQDIDAQQVRVFLAEEKFDAAEMILQQHGFDFSDPISSLEILKGHPNLFSIGLLFNCYLRCLLYRGEMNSGLDLATHLIAAADQNGQFHVSLEARLLRAQFYDLMGKRQACKSDLADALRQGQGEGIIAVFIEQKTPMKEILKDLLNKKDFKTIDYEYVKRIVAVFPSSNVDEQALPPLPDLLTDRELDVLILMAEGLKYKEIAAKLFVSLNTVRFHAKSIYGKFNVNNRTNAIETARKHQII